MGSNGGQPKLIAAKMRIPTTSEDYMSRPRLTAKLDSFARLPLTTVVAPAGYGKTSLMAAWASMHSDATAWYSLSEGDRQPAAFWNYLVTACSQALGEVFPKQALLTSEDAVPSSLVDDFLVALEESEVDVHLVLEDFHRLGDDETINGILLRIIEHAPATFHVVVVSRTVPSLRLAKLRMSDALGELTEDDLRFSRQETAHFLVKGRVSLPEGYLDSFCETACGWPIALKVAVLNLRRLGEEGLDQLPDVVGSFSSDYLYEEAVDQQPAFVKQFMLATACLDSFSVSIAASLVAALDERCPDFLAAQREEGESPEEYAGRALAYLVENNVFIIEARTLDGEPWYSYHALLSDALRYAMVRKHGTVFRESNRAAGSIMERLCLFDQAVQYYARAKDYDAIRDVIISQWREAVYDDNIAPMKRWFELLPDAYIERFPRLCLYQMPALYTSGQFSLAHRRHDRVVAMAKEGDDEYIGLAHALNALSFAVESRENESRRAAEEALAYLSEDEAHFRSMMLQVIAGASVESNLLEAKRFFEQACKASASRSDRNVCCSAYANLAATNARLGNIDGAFSNAADAQALYGAERERYPIGMLSTAYAAQALAFYLRGQLAQAQSCCNRFVAQIEFGYVARNEAEVEAVLAGIAMARGSGEEARGHLSRASYVFPNGLASVYPGLDHLAEWVRDPDALLCLRRCASSEGNGASFTRTWLSQALALVQGEDAFPGEVQSLIDYAPINGLLGVVEAHLLAAARAEKAADRQLALTHLACSLEKAASEKIVQPFLTASHFIAEPLRELAKQQPKGFASELYKTLSALVRTEGEVADSRPISDRELDVMRLVDAGLSSEEIAERLFISRETVKKHLGNIYSKLGVHSRTQAAATLRMRGLL